MRLLHLESPNCREGLFSESGLPELDILGNPKAPVKRTVVSPRTLYQRTGGYRLFVQRIA
jgi:hypothetical protein